MALSWNWKKGLAFIYNEEHNRNETHWDVSRFERICSNLDIKEVHNMKTVNFGDPIWATKFQECDYVVVYFGSHGYHDGVVDVVRDVNGSAVVAEELLDSVVLDPVCSFRELNGKLKWCITQTCQGVHDYEHDGEEMMYPDYYLISYPCQQGVVAKRIVEDKDNKMKGSIYLRCLEKALEEGIKGKSLQEILKDVRERRSREGGHEVPTFRTNFPGEFYFFN